MTEAEKVIKDLAGKVESAWKELKGEGDELKKAQDAFVADVEKAIVKDEPKEEVKKDEEIKQEAGTVEEKKEEAAATKARKMRLMRARKLAMASKIKKTKPVIRKSYKH